MPLEGEMMSKNNFRRERRERNFEDEPSRVVEVGETVIPAHEFEGRNITDDEDEEISIPEEVHVDVTEMVTNTPEVKKGKVNCELLNIRSDARFGDNIIGKARKDTEVTIFTVGGLDSEWLNVECELVPGVTARGYVMSKYIEEV